MVVDAHPDECQALAKILQIFGHEPVATTAGHASIARARAIEFHLAIIDLNLPDISGFEVARELRRLAAERTMYLVAIAVWGAPEDRLRALALDFDHHVWKPLDAAIVCHIVTLAERAAAVR